MRVGERNFQGDLESIGTSMKFLLGNTEVLSDLNSEVLTKGIGLSNLVLNGDFSYWSDGTSYPPDGWVRTGGASVARESTIVKLGTYSAKVTSDSDGGYMYQSIRDRHKPILADWKGRTVTFSCWVDTSDASNAKISIYDGVGSTDSDYHTGSGSWELLVVTRTLDSAATAFRVDCIVDGNIKIAYFDGAMLIEGTIPFSYSYSLQDHLYKKCIIGVNPLDALVGDTDDDYNAIIDYANGNTWSKNINKNIVIPVYFPHHIYFKDVIVSGITFRYSTDIGAAYIDRVRLLQRRTDDSIFITIIDHTANLGQGTTGAAVHELVDAIAEIESGGPLFMVVAMGGCTAADDAKVLGIDLEYYLDVHDLPT